MNLLSVLPVIFSAVVLTIAAVTSTKNPLVYLDLHATLIVIGGTIGAAAVSFRFERLYTLGKVFIARVLKGSKFDYVPLIQTLMSLAEAYRTNSPNLKKEIDECKDPFLREGMTLLMDGVFEHKELIRVLSTRCSTVHSRYHEEAVRFKALGKFPPPSDLWEPLWG